MAGNENVKDKGVKTATNEKQKPGAWKKIKKSVAEIRLEMKRVTWPSWRELLNYTITVLFVCALMGVLIYVLDISLQWVLLQTLHIGA